MAYNGLDTCDNGHEPIAFSSDVRCPLCAAEADVRGQVTKIDRLENALRDAQDEIAGLSAELDKMKRSRGACVSDDYLDIHL